MVNARARPLVVPLQARPQNGRARHASSLTPHLAPKASRTAAPFETSYLFEPSRSFWFVSCKTDCCSNRRSFFACTCFRPACRLLREPTDISRSRLAVSGMAGRNGRWQRCNRPVGLRRSGCGRDLECSLHYSTPALYPKLQAASR